MSFGFVVGREETQIALYNFAAVLLVVNLAAKCLVSLHKRLLKS